MTKFTLLGAGLIMLVVGSLHLLAPQMMMNEPKIALTSANHFHVIRAAYGGGFIGIATLFLLGAFKPEYSRLSLIAVAVLFFGFAFGRIFSIAVDGLPVSRYFGVLATELFFAVLAVTSLRGTTSTS
jgi:hypothetical protein